MIESSLLLTDLYQLTMLEAYDREGFRDTASFELFVRKLPPNRSYLVAAGIEDALDFLQQARFTEDELAYLDQTGFFSRSFLESLAGWRFTGDVDAVPEGTIFFADEPILRVTAPMPEAQLVETRLVNLVQFPTMVASKAARIVDTAPDALLVEFGARRAHGAEAAIGAARAAYLAGFAGTSHVLAGMREGIPIFGTMAHSYVMAHARERDAFVAFARAQPDNVVLLIDTYDVHAAVPEVLEAARILADEGITIRAVRIDSGDLAALARDVRHALDAGGHPEIGIFASGDLDEYAIARLKAQGAPIDGFGIGTRLTTSADAPYLGLVYKLQEYAGKPRRKTSHGKKTWPGRKQVYRRTDPNGYWTGDTLTLADAPAEGTPLLQPAMRGGRRVHPRPDLTTLRARFQSHRTHLPPALRNGARTGSEPAPYPVEIGKPLRELAAALDRAGAP